jgi:hypothetical protein
MTQSQVKKKVVCRTKAQIKVLDELFVKEIQSNMDIFFGQFSPTLTAKMKDDRTSCSLKRFSRTWIYSSVKNALAECS